MCSVSDFCSIRTMLIACVTPKPKAGMFTKPNGCFVVQSMHCSKAHMHLVVPQTE